MTSRRYRFEVAYQGLSFYGFQSQPHGQTIQDHLEKALAVILGQRVRILGSSRTDTGVSARHMVAIFDIDESEHPERLIPGPLIKSWNALLPGTIRVYSFREAHPDFHPIACCLGKIYRYRLWYGVCRDPFLLPYVWQIARRVDLSRFTAQLQSALGEHNFKSLTASGSQAQSFVRTVHEIEVVTCGDLWEVWIRGGGFLKHMIRNLVGTCVDLSGGRVLGELTSLPQILAVQDRRQAFVCAPGGPLTLMRCLFPGEEITVGELRSQGVMMPPPIVSGL